MNGSTDEQVRLVRQAFARARDRDEPLRRQWMVEFGYLLSQLALHGASDDPAVRRLIAETAPEQHYLPLQLWVLALDEIVEQGGDEQYEYALSMRSQMEFWRDFYRDAAPDAVELLETDEIDEMLAERAPRRYVSKIPEGIPASHIWWHRHDNDPR